MVRHIGVLRKRKVNVLLTNKTWSKVNGTVLSCYMKGTLFRKAYTLPNTQEPADGLQEGERKILNTFSKT